MRSKQDDLPGTQCNRALLNRGLYQFGFSAVSFISSNLLKSLPDAHHQWQPVQRLGSEIDHIVAVRLMISCEWRDGLTEIYTWGIGADGTPSSR